MKHSRARPGLLLRIRDSRDQEARNKVSDHLARRRQESQVHGGTAAQQIIESMD